MAYANYSFERSERERKKQAKKDAKLVEKEQAATARKMARIREGCGTCAAEMKKMAADAMPTANRKT
jgi:hypothetical protein